MTNAQVAPQLKQMQKEQSARLMRLATYFSVSIALIIIILKGGAWLVTDSLSLLSSLVDSILDIGASLLTFFAVRYALQPPDEDHRFGHGKAEDIAALIQSAFIAGSGLFILFEAIHRIVVPAPIRHELVGISIMVISSLLTLCLIAFQTYVIRKTRSTAIKADALHYQMDLLVNMLVIAAFMLSMYVDWPFVDTFFAIFIALYILKSSWSIGAMAFDRLMDKELGDEERAKIIEAIFNHKDALGVHDLRTRHVGIKLFIQFHVELDGSMTLEKAHKISDDIEENILKLFPEAEVLIHHDPQGREPIPLEAGAVVRADRSKNR